MSTKESSFSFLLKLISKNKELASFTDLTLLCPVQIVGTKVQFSSVQVQGVIYKNDVLRLAISMQICLQRHNLIAALLLLAVIRILIYFRQNSEL